MRNFHGIIPSDNVSSNTNLISLHSIIDHNFATASCDDKVAVKKYYGMILHIAIFEIYIIGDNVRNSVLSNLLSTP